jgi:hypothetical protein
VARHWLSVPMDAPGLFAGRQVFDFFNDGGHCHVETIPNPGWYSNKTPLPLGEIRGSAMTLPQN